MTHNVDELEKGVLTMGKISGVLCVTSYTSLPDSSVRLVKPEITSAGTPSSSSNVNETTP